MGKGTGTCGNRPSLPLAGEASQTGGNGMPKEKTSITVGEVQTFIEQAETMLEKDKDIVIEDVKQTSFYKQFETILLKQHSQTPVNEVVKKLGNLLQDKLHSLGKSSATKTTTSTNKNQPSLSAKEIEADKAGHNAGKNGTYKSTDQKYNLRRPAQNCIECGHSFLEKDAFHWTKKGAVHGWGPYDKTGTCTLKAKKEPEYLKCAECGETIYKDQPAHPLQEKGVWIHGDGTKQDTGTCLTAHNRTLKEALQTIGDDFVEGKITRQEMLALSKEVEETEEIMKKRLRQAWENRDREKFPLKYKKSSKDKKDKTPDSEDVLFDKMESIQSRIDKIEDLAELLTDSDFSKDIAYLKETDDPAYQAHRRYLDKQDSKKPIFELYQDLLTESSAAEDEIEKLMEHFSEDVDTTGSSDPTSECHCGSGMAYIDCHMQIDQSTENSQGEEYVPSDSDNDAAASASQG